MSTASVQDEQIIFNYNLEMIGFVDSNPNTQSVPAGFELFHSAQFQELAQRGNPGDFVAVVVDELGANEAARFARWADEVQLTHLVFEVPDALKNSSLFEDLRRSDHAAFWAADYSGAMVTDTAEFRYPAYHCQNGLSDVVENLDHDFSGKLSRLLWVQAPRHLVL